MTPAPTETGSWPKHLFRIATLVVPSALAWCHAVYSAERPGDLTDAVVFTLGPLWVLLAGALVVRTMTVVVREGQKPAPGSPILAQIDVLTASGTALGWLSAFAIVGAVWLGWASLAVVGLLGTALFHIVVLLTYLAVRGTDPMRGASISRRFVPAIVTEGDDVIEELRFSGTRIPIGFRLFVTGKVGPRWATSRHSLDAAESGAEVVLESEIGPAVRGEHDAQPLTVWLQDSFGLCRSIRTPAGAARLTVLPRLRTAEKAAALLARGDGPREPRPATRLPTEGLFRLREYQQGDDVRRIHWVRSLAARELIVRLPDELPPDRPKVRLVLDTYFPEAGALACDAPAEMLDSLVSVWLAVGRALAESGTRVTLVTAVPEGAERAITAARQDLMLRTPGPALRLGAQVSWQDRLTVDELLTDEATFVVARGVIARPHQWKARWIVVLPTEISQEVPWTSSTGACLPHPMGSSDNRWSHLRRESDRLARARHAYRRALVALRSDVARPPPGSLLASPLLNGSVHLEDLR